MKVLSLFLKYSETLLTPSTYYSCKGHTFPCKGLIEMTIFGLSLDTIYLIVLGIAGLFTIIYILFGDILDGFEILGFLNPALILAFFTFFSASGYVLEKITSLPPLLTILIAAITAIILDTLLNVFVLLPMASAEESLGYTEDSLKGRIGRIIIPVPENGFGEIFIESKSGMISRPAASFDNEIIEEGKKVLVLDIKDGVLYVVPYENELDASYTV